MGEGVWVGRDRRIFPVEESGPSPGGSGFLSFALADWVAVGEGVVFARLAAAAQDDRGFVVGVGEIAGGGDELAVAVAVGVEVVLGVEVSVGIGVAVKVGLGVSVALGGGLALAVGVGVAVGAGVDVAVGINLGKGVAVGVPFDSIDAEAVG